MHLVLFLFATVVASCSGAPKESSWQKCNKQDSTFAECLKESIDDALSRAPVKALGLVTIDPLELPSLVIGAGTTAVAFQQNFKNMKITGLSKMKVSKADMDFQTNTLTVEFKGPSVRCDFHYEINGKLLVLPISGDGPGSFDLENPTIELKFNLEEYEKKGKTYYKIKSHSMALNPSKIVYVLENLFNGDKTLGDNINRVLNDNWAEVFADVKSGYENAFGQLFASIFGNVLAKVPKSELFGDA